MLTATPEQEAVIAAVLDSNQRSVGITAYAGAAKTTTLLMSANAIGNRAIHYLVFGKAMAQEAKRKTASMQNMRCSTVHSLAYQAIGNRFQVRLNAPRLKAAEAAEACGIDKPWDLAGVRHGPAACARAGLDTVRNFCQSADAEIGPQHVPVHDGWDADRQEALTFEAERLAKQMWADMSRPDDWSPTGVLPIEHDHYLKMWALCGPILNCDYLFLDEAQDSNPITVHIVRQQLARCQLVIVGDPHQSIYEWRSAVNAMNELPIDLMKHLTMSFRFGESVANLVNPILTLLDDSKPPLRGNPDVRTTIQSKEPTETAEAYLSRTNAVMLSTVMREMDNGRTVHVVGGVERFTSFCYGILDLQRKPPQPPKHPWLAGFKSWRDLLDHVNSGDEHPAEDLVAMVRLVCQTDKGAWGILDYLKKTVAHGKADLNVGTVHQFKGAEFDSVALAGDFPTSIADLNNEELRLLYVALTRGRTRVNTYEAQMTLAAVDELIEATYGKIEDDETTVDDYSDEEF